jgi:AcrR family transcriptional regulator
MKSMIAEPETRQKILFAAAEQFRLVGPRKTSMQQIARHAGLARATLYLHFSGKKALYGTLLEEVTQSFVDEVKELVKSQKSAPRKFKDMVQLTAATYASNPVLLAALSGDSEFSIEHVATPIMTAYGEAILGPLREMLTQGIAESSIRDIDVDRTAYLIYELGNHLLVKELAGQGTFRLDEILDTMDDMVFNGIKHD